MFSKATFQVHYVTPKLVWDDAGAGAVHDFSCYAPDTSSGGFSIGHFGIGQKPDGSKPKTYIMSITGTNVEPDVVRNPLSYTLTWTDKDTGANKDGGMWKVNCPNGYAALSDLCTLGYEEPALDAVICIDEKYLDVDNHNVWIWDSKSSGAETELDVNGGGTTLTNELISATTSHGKTKTLKAIKPIYVGST